MECPYIVTIEQGPNVIIDFTGPSVVLPGGGITAYTHTQGSAAAVWTINHNLGYKPIIQVFTVGGLEIVAEVIHLSNTQAQVYLATAAAGSARCI